MSAFKYALNASTIRGTPILKQIEVAREAGYDAIELWFADVDAHLAAGGTMTELRRALDDHGLAVPTCIYLGDWFDASEVNWHRVLEVCTRRLGQAAQLGASHVIAGPPLGRADVALGARRYR